jgi:hypothetical protein
MRALPIVGACALALASLPAAGAPNGSALPHDLVLVLDWGEPRGPASFLSDLERELLATLAAPACFRSIRAVAEGAAVPDDLLLKVTVEAYREEIDFEFGVSDRGSPYVDTERLQVSRVEATIRAELRTAAEDASVRARTFSRVHTWRPRAGEDPAAYARYELIDGASRTIRKLVCKGSLASRTRQLERARAGASR